MVAIARPRDFTIPLQSELCAVVRLRAAKNGWRLCSEQFTSLALANTRLLTKGRVKRPQNQMKRAGRLRRAEQPVVSF
jgi:hypothetical protein